MTESSQVFAELCHIMLPYIGQLNCKVNNEKELFLDTKYIQKNRKPLFFGAVYINKNYVSYHLMPVYVNPKLLEAVSSDLKKHMQGKSCFNFTSFNAALFKELETLTESGFRYYASQGYV